MKDRRVRRRLWLEMGAAAMGLMLLALTLMTREWIELFFGVDPDQGSGAVEWAIVFGLLATSAGLLALARSEWHVRRPQRCEAVGPIVVRRCT